MTLETGVKELAEAVGADVKALADGKVNSNDPRLTDSREWSATTVTQAEAEAGTASARRAWTAQKVRQAINAWWQLVTSGFGRNFIAATNEQAARNVLQLGTAATRDAATSNTDTTYGLLMELGTWGFGGNSPTDNAFHADDMLAGQRRTWQGTGATESDVSANGLPALGGSPTAPRSWHVETIGTPSRVVMTATEVFGAGTTRGRTFIRVKHDATWHPWQELITAGNIQSTTGQPPYFPMSQKATTDAINARGFADASGVLTVTSGALSNDMSSFLSSLTFAEMRSKLDVISKQSVQALDPDTATLPDLIRALQAP